MKRIIMTTVTEETVTMGDAGKFKTGEPVEVTDDALADALLKRNYPKFEEAPTGEPPADAPAKADKKTK